MAYTTVRTNQVTGKMKFSDRLGYLWESIKKNKVSYLFIAPYMILFFIFTVLPVIVSIGLSFTYYNILEAPRWIGWDNYLRLLLHDDVFLIAVKNTFVFAIITGPISYFACLAFAWFINELSPKVRAFMTLVFYAPSISGQVYMIWQTLFSGDQYGWINGFLLKMGLILEPIQWLKDETYILSICILVQLWLSLGTGFLVFIASYQNVDRTLYEAGAVDGVRNRWQELWFITLPSIVPQMMLSAVLQIVAAFEASTVLMNLAGFPSTNYAAHTVVTHLYDYGNIRFEMGYASAIATILFFVMVGTNRGVKSLLGKIGR